jgi:hypothetical protein
MAPRLEGMTPRGIDERQRTWLAEEVAAWRAQGVVSREQASAILGLYGTSEERAEHRRSKSLLMLMGAAAFLVGLGVLLLIGDNWQGIPTGASWSLPLGRSSGRISGCISSSAAGRCRTSLASTQEQGALTQMNR